MLFVLPAGTAIADRLGMRKKNKPYRLLVTASPVIDYMSESKDAYFGFTCIFADGGFENIVLSYRQEERIEAFAAITKLHDDVMKKLNRNGAC